MSPTLERTRQRGRRPNSAGVRAPFSDAMPAPISRKVRAAVAGLMVCALMAGWTPIPAAGTPAVASVAPASGNIAGGTPLTIRGSGFLPGASVKVGNVSCTQVKVLPDSIVLCVTGPRAAGPVSVTVFNSASDSSATNSLFTYGSRKELTKTTKADFEAPGCAMTNVVSTGLDSTLRWLDWSPTTGGGMGAGTYYYVVTALPAAGETQRSVESPPTTVAGAKNAVRLAWTAVSGALGYRIYRTTSSGTYASPSLVAALDSCGYTDIAGSPSTGAPPASSTASGDAYLARGQAPGSSFSAGPNTTGNVGAEGCSLQRPDGKFLIIHANATVTTSIYDPVANTMSAGPNLTGNAQEGAQALKRPDGRFLVVHGNATTGTSIYDPVAGTMSAGPTTTGAGDKGGLSLKRPDGKFLIVHANGTTTTSIYDPVANTMVAGPTTASSVGDGAFGIPRPDGTFLIVHGSGGVSGATSVYDPVANTMSAGPTVPYALAKGAHALQRPDGRWLIVCGKNSTNTALYDPVANTMASGPATTAIVNGGALSIQRADGTFLIVHGKSTTASSIYDPVANTMSAGPTLPNAVDKGGHVLQRPDGRYLVVNGASGNKTTLYDAGWTRTGSYISEKLRPGDIQRWNTCSWVRDLDDTLIVRIRTAASSAGLDAAAWRTVANGGEIAATDGETWLQVGADFARCIPKASGALEDVYGNWRFEFRRWPTPDLLSFTASYTDTALVTGVGPASPPAGSLSLAQGAPNPFRTSTLIRFGVTVSTDLTLEVFSVTGQKVATLAGGWHAAGSYALRWDGHDLRDRRTPPGVYLYLLRAGDVRLARKLVLIQ